MTDSILAYCERERTEVASYLKMPFRDHPWIAPRTRLAEIAVLEAAEIHRYSLRDAATTYRNLVLALEVLRKEIENAK